jgi:hypothetical protein
MAMALTLIVKPWRALLAFQRASHDIVFREGILQCSYHEEHI